MTRTTSIAIALAASGILGCQGMPGGDPQSLSFALGGDGGAVFENVPEDDTDVFSVPSVAPEVGARMHSCQKLPYDTLGALLVSRGVNLAAVAGNGQLPTAGQLYKSGAATLGAPNYAARIREAVQPTTSGDTKLMDLFLMAAPEIIAAMPSVAACKVNGAAARMFDAQSGDCTPEGILCLTGTPAKQAQIDLCNQLLKDVPNKTGQQIAVAAILSAAHSCE